MDKNRLLKEDNSSLLQHGENLKSRRTDFLNTPSTTNLAEEEILDAIGNDGNESMLEQVNRNNPWRMKKLMMMMNYCLNMSC
jgi:hypothetical protein